MALGPAHGFVSIGNAPIASHIHTKIDFLTVCMLEGHGEEALKARSVHMPPPGIDHGVVDWSDDVELIEITSPGGYAILETAAEEPAEASAKQTRGRAAPGFT